jgi:hypothetical protein
MTSNVSHPVPPAVGRLAGLALPAAVLGLLGCALGFFTNPEQFYRSYLYGWLFWVILTWGCLGIAMLNVQTGGRWGLVIRRILEAGTRNLPLMAVLGLPILAGLAHIYPWAAPAAASDELIQRKVQYLNAPFFIGRYVFYFALWSLIAGLLNSWSARLDQGYDPALARRMRQVAGGGLVALGLSVSFASVDWAMSLNPHWFSTIYGIIFLVGAGLSAFTFSVLVMVRMAGDEPFQGVVQAEQWHDLGKLTFAFTFLWAYVNFSQFIITWSGNLPEEIPWYMTRISGAWKLVTIAVVVLHFALPYALLLSRDIKRGARLLSKVAALLFAMRFVELYWQIAPEMGHGHGAGAAFHPHWLDLAAPLGIGGLWLFFFARHLRARPLLPVGEPVMQALIEQSQGALVGRHA